MAHASLVKLAYNKVEKIKRVKKDHVEQPQHQEASISALFKKCDLSSTSVGRETDSHLAPHVVTVLGRLSKGDSQSEVSRFLF